LRAQCDGLLFGEPCPESNASCPGAVTGSAPDLPLSLRFQEVQEKSRLACSWRHVAWCRPKLDSPTAPDVNELSSGPPVRGAIARQDPPLRGRGGHDDRDRNR